MKTLGLMGGLSWQSTIEYYRLINELVNQRLGKAHSARCIISSVDFQPVREITERNDWDAFLELATGTCKGLRRAGAEAILLCANTAHIVADRLAPRLDVPLIHIVDATVAEIRNAGLDRVLLLGTRFTMERDFFKDRLKAGGIAATIPEASDREWIHGTIFGELAKGILVPATRRRFQDIIAAHAKQGAQGAILGCTEIPLIIKPPDSPVPVFDTTEIHSRAAVDFALG